MLYELGVDLPWQDSLFGAAKFTKNADLGKYSYFWYGFEFDACSDFSVLSGAGFG